MAASYRSSSGTTGGPAAASARTAVVTGCSTGFGHATALRLARAGWHVIATVRRDEDGRALAAAAGTEAAARIRPARCDITAAGDVGALAAAVAEAAPALHALVNNAGTAFPGPIELIPIDDLRAQLEVNFIAHVAVTQALLPRLREARGTIVNVSSVNGRIASPMIGAYAASKFALEAASDALRVEVAPFGVRVVVVEPASSPTAIWATSIGRVDELDPGPYAPLAAAMRRHAERAAREGFPADDFARLVERILDTDRPKPRYALPAGARRLLRLRRFLPDAWLDRLIRRQLGW